MSAQPTIVGAGLAGLLAAHAWTGAQVLEYAPEPRQMHNALLRFRTDAVAQLTGVEFRKVRVHKGIWSAQRFHTACTIPLANMYAQKVLGRVAGDRSIWSLESVERFIAPEDFYAQLVSNVGDRIRWGAPCGYEGQGPFVSTAPLPATLGAVGIAAPRCDKAPITVVRCRVTDADVFQTVYFPDADTPMYRASITGSLLLIEAMNIGVAPKEWLPRALVLVQRAFAIDKPTMLAAADQSYGKIAPLPDVGNGVTSNKKLNAVGVTLLVVEGL